MGYKLYREMRDRAPADWSHAERLVAWVIADDASDKTRRSWLPIAVVAERAGMSPAGARKALQRLARRGFELRVPITKGSDGRLVFAGAGHSLDFLVPELPEAERADSCPPWADGESQKGGPLSAPSPQHLSSVGPSQDLASRRGRAKRATAKRTVQSVIADVRIAAASVHGRHEAESLDDGHALALYYHYAHGHEIRDLVAYMVKIFGDAPYLDTFTANAGWCCPSCQRWEDECSCPAA